MKNVLRAVAAVACLAVLSAAPAAAGPISLSAHLTGDPRPSAPDNLSVNVSILGDANDAALTHWTVTLDMAASTPTAKLDEFAFNLGASMPLDPSLVGFEITNIAPNYSAQALDKLQGYGNGQANFLLTLDKKGAAGVNNAVPLTFTVRKKAGDFAIGDFLNAPCTQGADPLGCNQMAAHIQALSNGGGIAVGDYVGPQRRPATRRHSGTRKHRPAWHGRCRRGVVAPSPPEDRGRKVPRNRGGVLRCDSRIDDPARGAL